MGLTSMFSSKPDTQVYQTGAHTRTQNSRAYLLALIAYMGIFLFGYDTGVGGGVVSLKIFKQDFGYANASPKVIADNNSNVVSLLHVGAFFGALGAAPIVARTGRKWGLFIGCFIFLVGGVMSTAATHNLGPMIAGRVVCGFGVGVMSVVCPTYVSEMTPKEVRGRITGMFQIVVVVGVAFSYWITYAINVSRPIQTSASWRIPIAFQLVPCGIMLVLLPLIKESPRWLADKGRLDEALANLAWVRKRNIDDPYVVDEFNEICAAIEEEKANTSGASWKDTAKPGNRIRMFIAFAVFFLQQWSGQNSINYYAPEVFASIGLTGTSVGLLSSGIYGIVKIVATAAFIFLGIEKIGRKWALGFGGLGMSLFLWIIAAIFITHPVNKNLPEGSTPPPSSMAMAAMIYLFVIPYCFSWGPVPWVYCAEIFPMRIRHFGMSTAAATQWCFNFVLTKLTPYLIIGLPGGKVFILFACTNLLSAAFGFWLPETSGVSLEDMDILFGATTREERDAHIAEMAQKRADPLSAKEKDLEGEYEHNEHVEPAVPANRAAA